MASSLLREPKACYPGPQRISRQLRPEADIGGNALPRQFCQNLPQQAFHVVDGRLESVRIHREWRTEDEMIDAVFGQLQHLVYREATYSLYRNLHRLHDSCQLIEGARRATLVRCDDLRIATLVIADVMDDVVHTQVFQHPPCRRL